MRNVGIDLGKRRSYIIVEENGKTVKEGYADTTREGLCEFLPEDLETTVVIEASGALDRAASILEGYRVKVAHPAKLKLISMSTKKTDRNDCRKLLDLNRANALPEAYLPPKEIREARNLCRNRDFLVRQRTRVANRIRDQAYRLAIEFSDINRQSLDILSSVSPILSSLVNEYRNTTKQIHALDGMIAQQTAGNRNASLIDGIPGIGHFSALGIASEIGDVSRFPSEDNLFAYAGLVPRLHQSGSTEWKGRCIDGNRFLKYMLIECTIIHVRLHSGSSIGLAFNRISERRGFKKARVAAARHMLRAIYYMLRRNQSYDEYERSRRAL